MSHDNVVWGLLKGVFREERDTGKEKGHCRKVGFWEIEYSVLVKRKDVVRTVLQSRPLQL